MLRQVLPAVREAAKSDRSFWQGRGTSQCERAGAAVGENHWLSLVIAHPSGIAVSEIRKMRSQQRVEAIVAKIPLERHKANFLQHYISPGIGQHFFFDPVTAIDGGIGQFKDRHSWFNRNILEGTMAFLLGEEATAVGNNQAEVAGAGLIYTRKIDFIENAMTKREPKPALKVERGTHARLGA